METPTYTTASDGSLEKSENDAFVWTYEDFSWVTHKETGQRLFWDYGFSIAEVQASPIKKAAEAFMAVTFSEFTTRSRARIDRLSAETRRSLLKDLGDL